MQAEIMTTVTDLPDETLVRRICAGERELFEVLMRRHNPKVFRIIRSTVQSEDEAEELMQDAYVKAYAHLHQFAERAKFSTWLLRIALHEAWARARRRGREVSFDPTANGDIFSQRESAVMNPEDDLSNAELRDLLDEQIDALPENFRMVFVLREVEGLSVTETSEALGIAEDTVRTRAFRAREALRAAIRRVDSGSFREAYGFHLSRCDRVVAAVWQRILAN